MAYQLDYSVEARKAIRTLPGHVRQRARRMIEELAHDPRPPAAQELRDRPNRYRIRLGKWRIIYRVDDELKMVRILGVRLKTGPETYEELEE